MKSWSDNFDRDLREIACVILAGGFGTRLSEETDIIPKPMVRIGGFPILLHIMSIYASYGVRKFIICGGYKIEKIQSFFSSEGLPIIEKNQWSVEILDTGLTASTSARILQTRKYVSNDFFLTYGDGVGNIDIRSAFSLFKETQLLGLVTAVRPPARFGTLEISDSIVTNFSEKDASKTGWINGGFFTLNAKIFEFIDDLNKSFESLTLSRLVEIGQLGAYKHEGFWQPMDTLREKRELEEIWKTNNDTWPGKEFLA